MVYHEFPDLGWLKKQVEDNFASRKLWQGRTVATQGWPNVVLNVNTTDIYRDDIRGPVSIFANLKGESQVEADNRKVKIREGYFFVTNHDQRYTLEVEKQKAETFNVHFGEYFSDQVFSSLTTRPIEALENNEFIAPVEKVCFHNKLHVKSESFNRLASQIILAKNDPLLLEQKLYSLMTVLLEDHHKVKKSASILPSVKSSTREEIIKRLHLSTDYIYSFYDRDLSLDELAKVSFLSKFHYLRLFKLVFGKTPHQFITEVKIEKAKSLLRQPSPEVKVISRSLGFKDASTFSRLFFNQVGVYPSSFRQG
jgi:AraC family transcriptional regulator